MDDEDDGANSYAPTASQAAGGFLDGAKEAINQAGEGLLHAVKPGTRFLLKRIPGAPAAVYDLADIATAPNKTRAAFGAVGGLIGSVGGGALGTVAGGINAPIGAAVGSTLGQGIGEQVYDEHKAAIDHDVDDARQKLDATKQWITDRWREVTGGPR